MKRYIYLFGFVTFITLSCERNIEISPSNPVNPTEKPSENGGNNQNNNGNSNNQNNNGNNTNNNENDDDDTNLVGVWKGIFNKGKSSLCEKKYFYILTITKHKKEEIEGNLKVSVPEDNSYAIYKIKMTLDKNKLTIKTKGIDKKEEWTCTYCRENTYILKLSKNKKELKGKWTYSGYCSVNENSNIVIKLKKQK